MPIRTKPFTEITYADIGELIGRNVPEERTLEYKRNLKIDEKDDRIEFLKDVSAMANAAGGTIIYGIEEGSGEERGIPVAISPLLIEPDSVMAAIDHLVKDGLDERLTGVLQRAIPTGGEGYVYVLRIPASPLAPHMISSRTSGPRFYLRANTVNVPMNVRQIKEVVMQRMGAIENAHALIEQRLRVLRERAAIRKIDGWGREVTNRDQVVLHVVPLYPPSGGWNLGDPEVERRLARIPAFGAKEPYDSPRYTIDGLGCVFEGTRHVFFLRSGALEFQMYDPVQRPGQDFPKGSSAQFDVYDVERAVLSALRECRALTDDALLRLPVVVSLHALDVEGAVLRGRPGAWYGSGLTQRALPHPDVPLQPLLITDWDTEGDRQVWRMLDELWQAWGVARSWNFQADGTHVRYTDSGERIASDLALPGMRL